MADLYTVQSVERAHNTEKELGAPPKPDQPLVTVTFAHEVHGQKLTQELQLLEADSTYAVGQTYDLSGKTPVLVPEAPAPAVASETPPTPPVAPELTLAGAAVTPVTLSAS